MSPSTSRIVNVRFLISPPYNFKNDEFPETCNVYHCRVRKSTSLYGCVDCIGSNPFFKSLGLCRFCPRPFVYKLKEWKDTKSRSEPMKINSHLNFNGECAEAFKFYER